MTGETLEALNYRFSFVLRNRFTDGINLTNVHKIVPNLTSINGNGGNVHSGLRRTGLSRPSKAKLFIGKSEKFWMSNAVYVIVLSDVSN